MYPIFNAKGDRITMPTFGMELEFYVGRDENGRNRDRDLIAGLIHKLVPPKDRYMFKHDGTVRPGFEIVTMPMTRNYLEDSDLIPKILKTMTELVPDISRNIREHPYCGLHVHVGRKYLLPLQIYKMAAFCYINKDNLTLIGRRELNEYCKSHISRYLPDQVKRRGIKDERYSLINLVNHNTVEFRFFKGTTDINDIWVAIEFVDSLRAWCGKSGIKDRLWSIYYQYILNNKNLYLHLIKHIQAVGIDQFEDPDTEPRGIVKKYSEALSGMQQLLRDEEEEEATQEYDENEEEY
jgi:hypothetical protein